MESWVRLVGLLAFAVIGITFWMQWSFRIDPEKLPKGLKPVLALVLAESADELAGVLGEGRRGDANRQAATGELRVDFLFIAAYWLLFVAAGALLARRNLSWGFWLGAAAACCATGAAVFDIIENIRLLKVLHLPVAEITDAMAHGIRRASLVKWGLIFLTVGLLAPLFLWRSDWIVLIGCLYLSALVLGFVGVFFLRPAIGWAASYPMSLGLVVLAFLFTFWSKKFLQGF